MDDTAVAGRIHIRYEGQSWDYEMAELDIGMLSSDDQVREAVAGRLDAPVTKLRGFTIDRNHAENTMTLRPEAVFG